MSDPTDAEWEAGEEDRMYRQLDDSYEDEMDLFEERRRVWDDYRRRDGEQGRGADRTARILLTVFLVLLFLAVMFAAQTELNL